MTVLSIAQNVARETGFTAPSSLVGNADETAIQLLQLIKTEVADLSNGVIAGQNQTIDFNWQVLVKRGTFNLINAQEAYNVPADFKDYIPKTMWNYSTRRPVIVPLSAEDYEIQKNYFISSGIDKMIYFYNNQMHVLPVPASTDTINYEYTTTYIFQSSLGVGQTDIIADTDVCSVNEKLVQRGLKFRYLVAKGLIPSSGYEASMEYQNYVTAVQRAIAKDGMGSKSPISINSGGTPWWKAAYTQDSNYPAS